MNLLHLYPPAWRARYEDEMQMVVEAHGISLRTRIDLLRGALDAWLLFRRLPMYPSTRPTSMPHIRVLALPALFVAAHWVYQSFFPDSSQVLFMLATVLAWMGICLFAGRKVEQVGGAATQAALKGALSGLLACALAWVVAEAVFFVGMPVWADNWHFVGWMFGWQGWFNPRELVSVLLVSFSVLAVVSVFLGAALGGLGLKTAKWRFQTPITGFRTPITGR